MSDLTYTCQYIPQKAKVDLFQWSQKLNLMTLLKIKSLIGFTPISEDGMIILAWTDYKPQKYISKDQILEDHKKPTKNHYASPGQYFLCIPRGIFVCIA